MKYTYATGKHMSDFHVDVESFFEEGDLPVTAIFKAAAGHLGLDYDTCTGSFRSSEILVAKDVADKALSITREMYDNMSANTLWLLCGPKMQDTLPDGTIAISDKFYDPGQ